ncbi:MAG TPA: hypothetical protein VF179_13195 [Thermoanaerobaculia bacterium]|nr:hypothetical protein [Thermoanaerobaculia bacterium]
MRKRFGDWGAELSDTDFACALAAAGALWHWKPPRDVDLKPGLLGSRLWLFRTPEGVLPWRLPQLPPRLDARLLLEAWRSFRDFAGEESFRIEIEASVVDPLWILKQLSRPEVGAAAVESWEPPTRGQRKSPAEGSYSVGVEELASGGDQHTKGSQSYPADNVLERPMQAPSRWLQARLRSGSGDVETLRGEGSYEAAIRIGRSHARWVSVERPFPTPEEPPPRKGHLLTVIFWEPLVSPAPQVRPLRLPPMGNSREVSFPFEIPAGLERIAARVTVLHANRVLQTGLLRAAVGGRWSFTLDATPRTRLQSLSGRTEFDAALVLNHDDEGIPRLTAAAGAQAAVISLNEGAVTRLTEYLRDRISEIADKPERFTNLSSPGTVELLRNLAQKGGALHDHLCRHTSLLVLAGAKRIHLTSARADSFFPVEMLYRFDPPDEGAELCPNALAALQAGECPGGCPADKRRHVCPLGFWGLSRIIERHAHKPEHQEINGFRLQPEPMARTPLPLAGRALLAASDKASEVKKDAVEHLHQALARRGSAARVRSWPEWIAHVASDRPSLLVLLPHHEQIRGDDFLEIGEGDRLQSELVREEHVSVDGSLSPIVLLLGCETNLARIAFDNLVIRFRDRGAAVVVSTIATILGRHASPAAERLVELLDEEAREGNSTFGEVMVRLRRKLLETETPMALGLTAYGDADWILTRKDNALHRHAPRPLR